MPYGLQSISLGSMMAHRTHVLAETRTMKEVSMTRTPRILIVATSADRLPGGEATGLWLEELTTPLYALEDAGAEVVVASIAGGRIPVDARSLAPEGENDASVERFNRDPAMQARIAATPAFETLDADGFHALFLPGGHGTMADYPDNVALARLVSAFDAAGKVVAAVCHGPAALVSAQKSDGSPFVKGRRVAGFTDAEERAVGLDKAVPFLLETRLRALGAAYESGPDFEPFAIREGTLVTGQNPASAAPVARLALEALAMRETTA